MIKQPEGKGMGGLGVGWEVGGQWSVLIIGKEEGQIMLVNLQH